MAKEKFRIKILLEQQYDSKFVLSGGRKVQERSFEDHLIISSSSQWKKIFDFLIVLLALYSTYSATYL